MNPKIKSPDGQKKRAPIPQGVRFNVLRRDNFSCRYCGRSSPEVILHIDHAISVKDGGTDAEGNLVTACFDCNSGKSSKSIPADPSVSDDEDKSTGLIGMWGHTFDQNTQELNWQFKIIRKVSNEVYICQLFSWMDGGPTECKLLSMQQLLECKLYASHSLMDEAYQKYAKKEARKRDQEIDAERRRNGLGARWPDLAQLGSGEFG